jgi:hypothetical protein
MFSQNKMEKEENKLNGSMNDFIAENKTKSNSIYRTSYENVYNG